jgi:hypothetical protein
VIGLAGLARWLAWLGWSLWLYGPLPLRRSPLCTALGLRASPRPRRRRSAARSLPPGCRLRRGSSARAQRVRVSGPALLALLDVRVHALLAVCWRSRGGVVCVWRVRVLLRCELRVQRAARAAVLVLVLRSCR